MPRKVQFTISDADWRALRTCGEMYGENPRAFLDEAVAYALKGAHQIISTKENFGVIAPRKSIHLEGYRRMRGW